MAGKPKYKLPDIEKGIAKYLKETPWKEYTMCGLALACGFCERKQLHEYAKYEGYSPTIKRAMLMVEMSYEKKLSGHNNSGAIFALKNMKWKDKSPEDLIDEMFYSKEIDERINSLLGKAKQ